MQRLIAEVLAAWREAIRVAAASPPGSPEHALAEDAVARLHDLYQRLVAAAEPMPKHEAAPDALRLRGEETS